MLFSGGSAAAQRFPRDHRRARLQAGRGLHVDRRQRDHPLRLQRDRRLPSDRPAPWSAASAPGDRTWCRAPGSSSPPYWAWRWRWPPPISSIVQDFPAGVKVRPRRRVEPCLAQRLHDPLVAAAGVAPTTEDHIFRWKSAPARDKAATVIGRVRAFRIHRCASTIYAPSPERRQRCWPSPGRGYSRQRLRNHLFVGGDSRALLVPTL